ncbi:Dual specificity protein phosphatase PPS1 [Fulvia fulva]|uniref:Dual specificity protein phosphatase PPS1 n=1 Tax=Passalora fulva TaxID=5499 RepID=A0A9Q8PEG6_PASFU|nr:Dual specificity protein phosphatase PPS1 [Fulvia fulva]KAK4617935.1 Dual specificity protein phosphatase PPS1 [Fulvia fulva]KAK4618361.1 Dual specificity protein phosphatase PPS1 [Fulvia fulva]UJO20959.1 Dual specificity protein phosphatase PPS1 [Fulvia fulva]WPV18591.1 Dual specificity protein phosphatase PPS1 [Fulvia fulva]WPV33523.1 Dual specificity protein phosphatase PPS1 [Fulvia fulva]
MAAVLARPTAIPERTATPPPQLSINTSQRGTPAPVPNKHLPFCSPGPRPGNRQLDTPPASPPSPSQLIETTSLTHPPNGFEKLFNDPPVYSIGAKKLSQALDHLATQPLPSPKQVFPWLHGLHAENQLQLAFFIARKKALRKTPRCIRGITIVKAGGDLTHSRIKGAIAPEELLKPVQAAKNKNVEDPEFLESDPKEGFSVRNFQIQACKMGTVSDIVVYGDNQTPREEVVRLAKRLSKAQTSWQKKTEGAFSSGRLFNTFILSEDYTIVECDHDDLIQLDSEGCMTDNVMDFFHWERLEMCSMSAPSEIAPNVWLGPTPDPNVHMGPDGIKNDAPDFDLLIECSDIAQIPDSKAFKCLEDLLHEKENGPFADNVVHQLEFPGSGSIMPPTWSHTEVDGLVSTCQWIHAQANRGIPEMDKRRDSKLSLTPPRDADGDSFMHSDDLPQCGRKILIHCTDGYTESSLLALAYYMYANAAPVHDAWLQLHINKGRNFFAYGSDVHLLRAIEPRLLQASPRHSGDLRMLCPQVPDWLEKMDGSLPSRILPYMYLGNLGHANNPKLLQELGIGQVLSVGEPVTWPKDALAEWPRQNTMFIDKVQDNGVDPLTEDFGKCLEFIENGRKKGTATLVHCRVGVSRSATICIAEVMNELGLSFPRAYCFVRARRLNVIIQPHLRFSYELLKWEESQCQKRGKPLRRELEWATIAREIAAMNKPYSRQG